MQCPWRSNVRGIRIAGSMNELLQFFEVSDLSILMALGERTRSALKTQELLINCRLPRLAPMRSQPVERSLLDGRTAESTREDEMAPVLKDFSWKRMIEAVEAVRERACRAAAALRVASVPYAIAGGNAVAAWVARVDKAAVRNTQDVDILIRRSDFPAAKAALESVGFVHHNLMDVDCFIDGPGGSPRDAIHILYAAEKVRATHVSVSADVTDSVPADDYDILSLEALVRMKLNSFRRKDQVHLLDLLALGLVDRSWLPNLLPEHAARLQQLIDDPDG